MLHRVLNLVRKEVLQFARDRMLTTFLFMLPLLQLILLAQATGRGINSLQVAVLDLDHSAVSRALITELDNRRELEVRYFVQSEEDLRRLLDRGTVTVGVVFPRGLAGDLTNPAGNPQVQMVVDGSNSVAGSVALGAASTALGEYAQERLRERGLALQSPIDLRVTTRYNPTYNFRYFAIPAQVGFITYQITLAVASLGLARERELGTLEQLIVAPLSRWEILLGKAIPALIIGALNFLLMLGVAVGFFHVPLRGSFVLLFAVTLLFIAAEIGWGVLLSSVARTQQQAILFVFILAMVDITFSGYMVPVRNLPQALQMIAQVVPMYHYLIAIRAVMLKGAGLSAFWPHVLALAGLSLAVAVIAASSMRRRVG